MLVNNLTGVGHSKVLPDPSYQIEILTRKANSFQNLYEKEMVYSFQRSAGKSGLIVISFSFCDSDFWCCFFV
jgi:hypothetical protein